MQLVHVKQLKHAFKIQIFFLNLIEFCPCDHFSITYTHTATHSHVATSTFVLCVKEYIIDWSHVTANTTIIWIPHVYFHAIHTFTCPVGVASNEGLKSTFCYRSANSK